MYPSKLLYMFQSAVILIKLHKFDEGNILNYIEEKNQLKTSGLADNVQHDI